MLKKKKVNNIIADVVDVMKKRGRVMKGKNATKTKTLDNTKLGTGCG